MTIKIYFTAILLCTGLVLSAQEIIQPKQLDDPNKGIIYNKEFAIGLRLHTNGMAAGVSIGKIKTYYLTKYFHIELGELKHPKEIRQSFDAPSTLSGRISRAFKYGKQNNLYALRVGIGRKRYFSEKAKHKGVAVGISYELGPTLGLLKPYYLELRTEGGNSISKKYSEQDAARFLDLTQIHGSSGWSKGFGEISLLPGAHGRAAVHFDWGAFDEYLKSVEAGIMVDVFTKKAPIMVEQGGVENNQLFLNLFIHLQFGKRY
ncbi:MAG: hypothetical protein H6577_08625 [Lewinellaceae bacterium]|nr:hypothetical protein [Saprospiraceae bacterium]MCB9338181.1 hypothetical protein [Lewinellaceae bacterium]